MACSLLPCQKKTESSLLDWSGSGSSSRELFNEIHFLPNDPLPNYISLGPDSEDFNVIREEDFSSNGKKKGNVFVDDFYYDYNFINFHEDLSYDAVDEKDGEREDLKPDVGMETVDNGKGSKETRPRFHPTLNAESGHSMRPTVGQNTKGEHDNVQDGDTIVSLHNTSVASFPTTSFMLKSEGMQATLLEDSISTSATGRHFPFPSSGPVPLDGTQGDSFTQAVLKDDTAATVSSTSSPDWVFLTSVPPFGKSSSVRGNTAGLPERAQDPARSREIFGQGGSPDDAQEGHGERNSTGRATVTGSHGTTPTPGIQDVPMNTVTTAAARTGGPSPLSPSQSLQASEAPMSLSVTQGGRETSEDPDYITSSPSTEGPQIHQHYPSGVKSSGGSLATTVSVYQETTVSHGNKVFGSPTPSLLDLQLSTEPSTLEQTFTSPSRFPSTLPTPRRDESNEIQAELDTEFVSSHEDQEPPGNSSTAPGKNSPSGGRWTLNSSNGGLGPGLKTEKRQEGEEASSSAPSATVTPISKARWEAGNWSEASEEGVAPTAGPSWSSRPIFLP